MSTLRPGAAMLTVTLLLGPAAVFATLAWAQNVARNEAPTRGNSNAPAVAVLTPADQDGAAKDSARPSAPGNLATEELRARWVHLRAEYIKLLGPVQPPPGADDQIEMELTNQVVKTKKAEASYQEAKLALRLAEIELEEFEAIAKRELVAENSSIEFGRTAVDRARVHVDQSKIARQQVAASLEGKGAPPTANEIAARLSVDRTYESDESALEVAKLRLEEATLKVAALTKYGHPMRRKERQAAIEKAKSNMLACLADWDINKVMEQYLERKTRAATPAPPSADEKKLAAQLADAIRWSGRQPPWEEGPDRFKAYLDQLESKLGELRPLVERFRDMKENEHFTRLSTQVSARAR